MIWKTYRIEQIVEDIQSGFACGDKDVIKGYHHLRMNNIHPDGKLDLTLLRRVPPSLVTPKYRLHKGDMIVCTTNSGKLVGKSALFDIDGDYAFSNHLTRLRLKQDIADPAFVQKMIWLKWQLGEIEPLCKHWVNQSTLPKEALLALEFQIPSLDDQRRIAGKLDRIAAHLDEVKARLATIPALLKRFRQSILAAACSGRLTEDWRRNSAVNNIYKCKCDLPISWRRVIFGELISELRNGVSRRPDFEPPGQPILRISAVRPGSVDLSDYRFLKNPSEKESAFSICERDILFTRYNGNKELVGVCGVVRNLGSFPILYPDKLIRVRLNQDVLPEWVEIYFSESSVRERIMEKSKSSAGQNGISGADLKAEEILLPTLEEQLEIVRRVKGFRHRADAVEARYNKAMAFVDKLMPAILAKAFRGELG